MLFAVLILSASISVASIFVLKGIDAQLGNYDDVALIKYRIEMLFLIYFPDS